MIPGKHQLAGKREKKEGTALERNFGAIRILKNYHIFKGTFINDVKQLEGRLMILS